MTPRERIEMAADRIAETLGLHPEAIAISAEANATPFVCLTAPQAERLLWEIERVR